MRSVRLRLIVSGIPTSHRNEVGKVGQQTSLHELLEGRDVANGCLISSSQPFNATNHPVS